MPLLKIQTNQAIDETTAKTLIKDASARVAELLGKPERYVMVSLEHNPDMVFGGSDEPLAYLELKSIGLPESRTGELSSGLCKLLNTSLDLPADRVYIEFADAARHMWGWNEGTFQE
ncbi:macrophage migration inhibitory factor (MIF) [Thiogranum longum]|uniref:L-dopachrome isomerase n=1 Tax=Thiogranum longum TaxID=1537524 RepID=A0A4R1H745_9GAMM|nr:phenylpyruvate tautomerase MIF-related protein [Thiogranum longum]TCK17614.1 macrophage migration inhibitory factor (MIF) [Thiogranum longum]